MKRLLTLILAMICTMSLFALTACGNNDTQQPEEEKKEEVTTYDTETLTIKSDGKDLGFRINTPKEYSGKLPVLVLCVGAEQVLSSLKVFATTYVDKGYATVQFDYTNTGYTRTTSEGELKDLTISSMTGNVNDIMDYLAEDNRFDMNNVSILGYSLGGLIASVYASQHPDRISRLIAYAPAYDMYYYAHGTGYSFTGEPQDGTPRWGDPYAEGATDFVDTDGSVMCLQYIRECWDLNYDTIFDPDKGGYGGPIMYCVGTADMAMTYGQLVLSKYMVNPEDTLSNDVEFERDDVNVYIIPNATHNMINMQTETLLECLDDFLAKYPLHV